MNNSEKKKKKTILVKHYQSSVQRIKTAEHDVYLLQFYKCFNPQISGSSVINKYKIAVALMYARREKKGCESISLSSGSCGADTRPLPAPRGTRCTG